MLLRYAFDITKLNLARAFDSPIKPRFINFLLTYRCNARCRMCQVWDIYGKDPELAKNELSLQEIERFLSQNMGYLSELRNLGLSGGDPLLMRSDFVELVRLFRKYLPGVHLGVQTNGLIPELAHARLKEIVSFYPDFSLAVSIDGSAATHEQVRGIKDALAKAVETVRLAQGLGIRNITSGMTITTYNYKEICEVKRFAQSLGTEFSCFPPEVSDYFNNRSADCSQLTPGQWSEVVRQLKECCGYHYYMDNLRLQLERKRTRHLPCFSGFTSLVIDPYGNVKPCVLKVRGMESDVFGNIRESTLKQMLSTEQARLIRKQVKRCSCWCQCEVSSSVMVAPLDILTWFILYSPDKKGFLKHISSKKQKYASLT